MGTWLTLADPALRRRCPALAQRHAILLTDGDNQHETPEQLSAAIEAPRGRFQCDCRGVGLRLAGGRGAPDRHGPARQRRPHRRARADGRRLRARSCASRWAAGSPTRRCGCGRRRAPRCCSCARSRPTVEDLTAAAQEVNALTGAYPTGAWGDESRDYHVAVRLPAKAVGQEQLAARVQLAVGDEVVAQGLVKAMWSDDDTLTTRIDPAVAHYTGQAELAEAIQDGLAAKAAGDTDTATTSSGRAVQLAAETGNDEATTRLRKIVEIDDAGTGTVRLRRSVDKLDEMALDTASTKTDPGEEVTRSPRAPSEGGVSTSPARRARVHRERLLRHLRGPHPGGRGRRAAPAPAAAPRVPRRAGAAGPSAGRADPAGRCRPAGVPQLRLSERRRGAVLRGLRLRLHHRHHAAPAGPLRPVRGRRAAAARRSPEPGDPWPPAIAVDWVAEVWVDPDWYAAQESDDPLPVAGAPGRRPARGEERAGRAPVREPQHPPGDRLHRRPGVSRRQAQLTTDGKRWWVEDLQSSNGTYVGPASGPLPTDPVPPGQRVSSPRTTGSTWARGPGSSCGAPPRRNAASNPGRPPRRHNFLARCGKRCGLRGTSRGRGTPRTG